MPDLVTSSPPKRTGLTAAIIAIVVMIAAVAIAAYVFTSQKSSAPTTTPDVTPSTTEKRPILGFSMYDRHLARWERDVSYFTAEANLLGADVIVEYADNDGARQEQQVKSMLARGAEVLVVTPLDSTGAAPLVDIAHKSGVKVIAYDRMINSASLDYYVSFDSVEVGRLEAQGVIDAAPAKANIAYLGGDPNNANAGFLRTGSMAVLDPLIKSGSAKLVLDTPIIGWNTDEAYQKLKTFLKAGGKVDGVVGANDSIAQGAISALKEFGLAGKVPVSGQDADLANMHSLVEGTQTVDVYKPLKALATKAAEMAVAAAKGGHVEATDTLSNGMIDVPAVILPSIAVTKDNIMDTVVKDGFYTREDIYGTQP